MNAVTDINIADALLCDTGIARKALHEEVADRLRILIMEGDLQPGERLNERC
jgi:DNA-binding GntR family transcriptional regulator